MALQNEDIKHLHPTKQESVHTVSVTTQTLCLCPHLGFKLVNWLFGHQKLGADCSTLQRQGLVVMWQTRLDLQNKLDIHIRALQFLFCGPSVHTKLLYYQGGSE